LEVGVLLPYLVPTSRDAILEWCRRLDAGPFAYAAIGERINYDNADQIVMLAAAAALTARIRLYTHITILPLHPAALFAKRAATLDVLSGGRLTIGVGVGGSDRPDDYAAAGASWDGRWRRQDELVSQLRRLWAGEPPVPGGDPVGPPPIQPGGPPIYTGNRGPKALARAATWADGFIGFNPDASPPSLARSVEAVTAAWTAAARERGPRLLTSLWFALGPDGPARLRSVVGRYRTVRGRLPESAAASLEASRIDSADKLSRALDDVRSAGFDGLTLIPTTDDLAELDRLEEVLARFD
jgi:alkanesulfonate monooxygenase SsuD/methylene tetrahydromethanopterin reductase-like flavin-dependent oxidoreductase (luciferase family)